MFISHSEYASLTLRCCAIILVQQINSVINELILRNGLMYLMPKPYILLSKTIHFTQQNHTFYSAKPYILLSKTIHFTQQNHTFYLVKPYILLLNRLTKTSIWINKTRVFGCCPRRESERYNRESLCQALMRGERREAVC
jgi:hypothetical protein